MMKRSKLCLCLLSALVVIVVMVAGCTLGTEKPPTTETPVPQNMQEQTAAGTSSPESSSIKIPWPKDENPVPPYSEEEQAQLVEEAKQEIMRVFPDLKEDTLDSYSWYSTWYSGYRVPAIFFTNVVDNSKFEERKALNEYFDQRIVEIKYDPERKIVTVYVPYGIFFTPNDAVVVSSEEAKERSLEFYKNVMGDEYEVHQDDLIVIRDDGEDANSVFLNVEICTTYKGVVYAYDNACVVYDMRFDSVRDYLNFQRSPEIQSQITTLSPSPDISLEEAKDILEERLKEKNDGNKVDIEYCQRYGYYEFPYLQWLDRSHYMDIEDGYVRSPVKLIWELPFITPNGKMNYGTIDAHTGEIIDIDSQP